MRFYNIAIKTNANSAKIVHHLMTSLFFLERICYAYSQSANINKRKTPKLLPYSFLLFQINKNQ